MALIGTIRKNFWFVLILLGLALAAFIIMDMTSAGNAGNTISSLTLAEVNGDPIDYREFQQTEQSYYSAAGTDVFGKRQTVWDFYVEQAVLNEEADAMGLHVPTDELMELQFGPTPSPIITANWRNPQTGQLDVANLNQIRSNIENNQPMDPRFIAYWAEQEKQIIKETIQGKLNNLISNSVYTPAFMAEESYAIENSKVDFNYVKIPFDQIDAADIEVTDADLLNYLEENRSEFESKTETRSIKYAVFDVIPTQEDSMNIKTRLEELNKEFAITTNDSLFVSVNKGSYSHLYSKLSDIPEELQEGISNLAQGEIYGPVASNGYYISAKLLDKRVIPDSVTARHILIRADRNAPATLETAQAMIDSIRREYTSGRSSFDSLAIKHSADTQSGLQGGELGTFVQETMVPEFMKACFVYGKKGGLYEVTTQFGIHLIRVDDQIFIDREPKYNVATLGLVIKPSQETQDNKYDEVAELVSGTKDMVAFEEMVNGLDGIVLEDLNNLGINDYTVGPLGPGQTSREIVKWAFDASTEVADVSPEVYSFTDPINYYDSKYVLIALNSITAPGLPDVATVRSDIETAVLNKKKGEKLKSSLNVTSLQDVANQFGVEVETASDVAMNNRFIPGMGNEPDVVGSAFALTPQSVSQPIVGNSGVYVVSPLSQQAAGAPSNIPFLQNSLSTTTQSQVNFMIIQNMKDRAKVKDDRYKFF
ncbi:MAG: hypothetical protein HKN09_12355 [Saprospiraceae bacterium]|nr:hypothetical protein [Saprospiraceae bacterium]